MNYEDYIAANRKVGTFGIKYLDDELGGILRGDLVLIGAASGAGKSTIADIIASHNSKEGKHVTLISLENFDGDNFVQKMYYIYKNISQQWWLTLRNFACGDYDINTYALQEAENKAKEYYLEAIGVQSDCIEAIYNLGMVNIRMDAIYEAIQAFALLTRTEGIIPAIESAHAVAYAMKLAPTMDKDKIIVVTISGRGDKDCAAIARYRGVNINE